MMLPPDIPLAGGSGSRAPLAPRAFYFCATASGAEHAPRTLEEARAIGEEIAAAIGRPVAVVGIPFAGLPKSSDLLVCHPESPVSAAPRSVPSGAAETDLLGGDLDPRPALYNPDTEAVKTCIKGSSPAIALRLSIKFLEQLPPALRGDNLLRICTGNISTAPDSVKVSHLGIEVVGETPAHAARLWLAEAKTQRRPAGAK